MMSGIKNKQIKSTKTKYLLMCATSCEEVHDMIVTPSADMDTKSFMNGDLKITVHHRELTSGVWSFERKTYT